MKFVLQNFAKTVTDKISTDSRMRGLVVKVRQNIVYYHVILLGEDMPEHFEESERERETVQVQI